MGYFNIHIIRGPHTHKKNHEWLGHKSWEENAHIFLRFYYKNHMSKKLNELQVGQMKTTPSNSIIKIIVNTSKKTILETIRIP